VLGRATGNSNTQDSSRPRLGGSHCLPPYSILRASPRGLHPNGILSWDSQVGVSKFPHLGLWRLWRPITSCADLRLQWGLKQSSSICQKLFNIMFHVTYTQQNRVNSQLVVIGSQIANLTLDLSFGPNLGFRCPNGQCEPILDIYVSINFQWYKEIFKLMGFDPFNHALKIQESIWDSNSQHGNSLGSVRVHSITLFGIPESMWCDSWVFLLARNLTTPYLGHKPKARVATNTKSAQTMH
jgi:hypothetical protein